MAQAEFKFSDEEIKNIAADIVPTVYLMRCPHCLAPPQAKCREQVSSREFADRAQPHMERITKAVKMYIRAITLQAKVDEIHGR